MSESVVDVPAGDSGEATGQGATGDTVESMAAEDAAAEQELHGIMQAHDPDELMKQVAHWKQAAQKHERTARDNSKAAQRLRELEDANKSELQKATEAREAAIAERDAVLMQQSRMMAAAAHSLSPDLIDYLGNGTAEEIGARAEQLAGIIDAEVERRMEAASKQQTSRQPVNGGRRPVENMRPGASPVDNAPSGPDDMFRQLLFRDQD